MHPFEDLVVPDGTVGIHWFGQSSFGLKNSAGTIVQVDPYYPRERPADRFIHSRPPLDETSLRTDYVLLTHDHGDHTCLESIDRLRGSYPDARFIGPPESAQRLDGAGIDGARIKTVTAGDTASMGTMSAHTVWAKPPAGDADSDIAPPDVQHLGYVVDIDDSLRVYLSGDPINTFAEHDSLLDPIRQLQPSIGFLTNHPTEGEFPFFEGSCKTAASLGLKAATPAHYGCFVTRDYDPREWASHLSDDTEPLIIAYNQSVIYAPS
jgi:L-ascorbate metabolism protein UlaG (beta-lactamase superfamily)